MIDFQSKCFTPDQLTGANSAPRRFRKFNFTMKLTSYPHGKRQLRVKLHAPCQTRTKIRLCLIFKHVGDFLGTQRLFLLSQPFPFRTKKKAVQTRLSSQSGVAPNSDLCRGWSASQFGHDIQRECMSQHQQPRQTRGLVASAQTQRKQTCGIYTLQYSVCKNPTIPLNPEA